MNTDRTQSPRKHIERDWRSNFDERQNIVIENCLRFANRPLAPNTHAAYQTMLIVAKMAGLLDERAGG